MNRSIIIFPQFSNLDRIQTIRDKYDPLAQLIKPHITLVFPFRSSYSFEEMKDHVQHSLSGLHTFPLVMHNITGSQDEYLFLNVKQGNDDLIRIHDLLYAGLFSDSWSRRITYQPHITVGRIAEPHLYNRALDELADFDDYFETVISEIHVEIIGAEEQSEIECIVQLEKDESMLRITSERLLIRDFVLEDWIEVHSYASDLEVAKYMIWGPNSEEETREFISNTIEMQRQKPRKDFECAVILKETGKLIGGCGLRQDGKQGEIGYCFNPQYWRQGYASEAAAVMIDYGFKTLGMHRIFATCRPENIGSAKVMEKAGLQREGHLREHMYHKGNWHDSYLYSILEHELK